MPCIVISCHYLPVSGLGNLRVEVLHSQYLDRVVNAPVVMQRQQTTEIPQVPFSDRIVDAPVVIQR